MRNRNMEGNLSVTSLLGREPPSGQGGIGVLLNLVGLNSILMFLYYALLRLGHWLESMEKNLEHLNQKLVTEYHCHPVQIVEC